MSQKKSESLGRSAALAEVAAHLQSNDRLSHTLLTCLSDLSADELGLFSATWGCLSAERKCAVLGNLRNLAEDNVGYDFDAVLKNALSDADSAVRQAAIEGLWENEEPSLIHPLLDILVHDSSDTVRESAAVALGRFAFLAECRQIDAANIPRLSQPLLTVANNPDEPLILRRRALEAAAPLSLSDVTQAIWAAYRCEEPEMRTGAIQAMGLNRDLLWLPTIIQALASDNPEIRYVAAGAAGALGEPEASPLLIELLDDPDPEVRLAAVQSLGDIGGDEAKRALKHILNHEDEYMREAAASALAEISLFDEPLLPNVPGWDESDDE